MHTKSRPIICGRPHLPAGTEHRLTHGLRRGALRGRGHRDFRVLVVVLLRLGASTT